MIGWLFVQKLLRAQQLPRFSQPLVLVHPDTGRRSIFCHTVNMMRLENPDGSWLSWDDSQQLLLEIFQPVVAPGRAIVHNWAKGDLVFWDNRCTLHSVTPTNFYHNKGVRLMHRISLVSAYTPESTPNDCVKLSKL